MSTDPTSHSPQLPTASAPVNVGPRGVPGQAPVNTVVASLSKSILNNIDIFVSQLKQEAKNYNGHTLPLSERTLSAGVRKILREDVVPLFDRDGYKGWSNEEQAHFNRYLDRITAGEIEGFPSPAYVAQKFYNDNLHAPHKVTSRNVLKSIKEAALESFLQFDAVEVNEGHASLFAPTVPYIPLTPVPDSFGPQKLTPKR